MQKGVIDQKNTLTSDLDMQNLRIAQLAFGLLYVQDFLIMTFRNGAVYPVYMKTYDVLFLFENMCDYYYMIGSFQESL